jgi:hypothetical protein
MLNSKRLLFSLPGSFAFILLCTFALRDSSLIQKIRQKAFLRFVVATLTVRDALCLGSMAGHGIFVPWYQTNLSVIDNDTKTVRPA